MPRCGYVRATDPAQHELQTMPWSVQVRPLRRGSFASHRVHLVTPRVTLYREAFAAGTRVEGRSPRGRVVLGVAIRAPSGSRYWSDAAERGGFVVVADSVVDVLLHPGHEHLALLIDQDFLQRGLDEETFEALARGARARRIAASRDATAAFARWGAAMLVRAQGRTGPDAEAATVVALERGALAWARRAAAFVSGSPPRIPGERRDRAVARALGYLEAADSATLTVPRIVAVTGVSQRSLEYAFRERFGSSVLGYVRRRRLHCVRRDLLLADPSGARVGEVVARYGGGDRGRFAGAYRRYFGELPSETLRSSPPRLHATLGPL